MIKMEVLLLFFFFFAFGLALSESQSSTLQPHAVESFNVSYIQLKNAGTCPYTVVISTSCSSPKYTTDHISIAFGDAYGNQIYAPRLDDPSTGTFESCSSDTFQIYGPCAYQICYVYLYRTGTDGWKPESVKIYGQNTKAVTFTYNKLIPRDKWYGFNSCSHSSSAPPLWTQKWFIYMVLGFVLSFWL